MRRLITIAAVLAAGLATAQEHQRVAVETTTKRVSVSAGNTAGHMPESLYSSCVGWWDFGRDSGTNYFDCSRSGYNLNATNAAAQPAWTNANGGGVVFDGTSDYLTGVGALTNSGSMTVSFWMRADTTTASRVFGQWYNGATSKSQWHTQHETANQFQFFIAGNDGGTIYLIARSKPVFASDVMVTCVYTGGTATTAVQIWTNAISAHTNQAVVGSFTGWNPGIAPMTLGTLVYPAKPAGDSFFKGRLYSIAKFNRYLTPAEITNLYNATKGAYGL